MARTHFSCGTGEKLAGSMRKSNAAEPRMLMFQQCWLGTTRISPGSHRYGSQYMGNAAEIRCTTADIQYC